MLTKAGFELAPSGYRSATLPVELSSPQRLEASFIQFKCTKYFQLTSAMSDYHEKFLFVYFSENDSEIDLVTVFKVFRLSCSRQRIVLRNMAVSVASVTTVAHREIAKNYNVGYKFAANKSY